MFLCISPVVIFSIVTIPSPILYPSDLTWPYSGTRSTSARPGFHGKDSDAAVLLIFFENSHLLNYWYATTWNFWIPNKYISLFKHLFCYFLAPANFIAASCWPDNGLTTFPHWLFSLLNHKSFAASYPPRGWPTALLSVQSGQADWDGKSGVNEAVHRAREAIFSVRI